MERNIRYQYFKIDAQIKLNGAWVDAGEFDFVSWVEYVSNNNLEQSMIKLKDTKARIEKIKFFSNADVWVVRFMKLREENIPYLAKENTDAENIPLQEDEYIGEDMYMLYDINTHIAMIQSNRFSLGLTRLAEFFIKSQNKNDEKVRFFPIVNAIDLSSFGKDTYRTFELGFANIVGIKPHGKSALSDIFRAYNRVSGVSGTIKIGIGRARDGSLDAVEINQMISEIGEHEEVVSAKVKIKDDDLGRIEVVDLLDEHCHDIITYDLGPRETIAFDSAALKMIGKYKKAKDKLVSLTTVPN